MNFLPLLPLSQWLLASVPEWVWLLELALAPVRASTCPRQTALSWIQALELPSEPAP